MREKNKKKNKAIGFFLLALLFSFCFAHFVVAAEYMTHEQIPGAGGTTDDFPTFLNQLYTFGIGISAVLAMIMIGAGAFIYIVTSAGNASKMADGKDIITSALFGLLIAMFAYLILFLVNPDLTSSSMNTVCSTADHIRGVCP